MSETGTPAARVSKGQRTREDILGTAARLASVSGMEGLSIGTLATELGMSKAGLLAHFGTKQGLQLAMLEHVRALVMEQILKPTLAAEPGLPQLLCFAELYADYIVRKVMPGGCFITAASLEFDDREGPVREQICEATRKRNDMLAGIAAEAVRLGQVRVGVDMDQWVFEYLAIIQGAVVRNQLLREGDALPRALVAVRNMIERIRV